MHTVSSTCGRTSALSSVEIGISQHSLAPAPSGDRLLTAVDVAQILRTGSSPVIRMCEAGDLPSVRIGGVRLIPHSSVTRFIAQVAGGKHNGKSFGGPHFRSED